MTVAGSRVFGLSRYLIAADNDLLALSAASV